MGKLDYAGLRRLGGLQGSTPAAWSMPGLDDTLDWMLVEQGIAALRYSCLLSRDWSSDVSGGFARAVGLPVAGQRAADQRGGFVAARVAGALQRAATRAEALRNSTASGKAYAWRVAKTLC